MAWTAPRLWTTGEIVTAAMMNTYVSDNTRYLKGQSGPIALENVIQFPGGASIGDYGSADPITGQRLAVINALTITPGRLHLSDTQSNGTISTAAINSNDWIRMNTSGVGIYNQVTGHGVGIGASGAYLYPSGTLIGTGAVTKIGEYIAPGAANSITFNPPQTYRHLHLIVVGRTDGTGGVTNFWCRFNGDAGANYSREANYVDNNTPPVSSISTVAQGWGESFLSSTAIAGSVTTIDIWIYDYARTAFFKSGFMRRWHQEASNTMYFSDRASLWRNTGAITTIVCSVDGSNFVANSTFTLYGIG